MDEIIVPSAKLIFHVFYSSLNAFWLCNANQKKGCSSNFMDG